MRAAGDQTRGICKPSVRNGPLEKRTSLALVKVVFNMLCGAPRQSVFTP